MSGTDRCPYEVLGVSSGATQAELRSAYRGLARVLHPDRPTGSASRFAAVARAYAEVSTATRRAAYDASTRRRSAAPPTPRPASPARPVPDLTHVGATLDDLDARWSALVEGQRRARWWRRR